MKSVFVLLLPVVLVMCGATSAPVQEASPRAEAEAVAAIKIMLLGGHVWFDATGEVVGNDYHAILSGEMVTPAACWHFSATWTGPLSDPVGLKSAVLTKCNILLLVCCFC